MKPTNILKIQEELKEYRKLCSQYNHSPAKEEFEEIVKFILLYQGGQGGSMLESNIEISKFDSDYLYEDFLKRLNFQNENLSEALTADGEKEFDSAVDMARDVAGKLTAGAAGAAAGAIGLATLGAISVGGWISYLFKKGKVKSAAEAEYKTAEKKLMDYIQIYKLKLKKAELEGSDPPKGDWPEYPA